MWDVRGPGRDSSQRGARSVQTCECLNRGNAFEPTTRRAIDPFSCVCLLCLSAKFRQHTSLVEWPEVRGRTDTRR
jgi:hypothetical protein